MMDWITRMLLIPIKPFITKKLGSILRTALGALSGYLIAQGIMKQEDAETFIGVNLDILLGTATYLFTQISSWIEKQKR